MSTVTGIILAGGASSRLGQDKRLVEHKDGQSFLNRSVQMVKEVCGSVTVLADVSFSHHIVEQTATVVKDQHEYQGPLVALAALGTIETDWAFVTGVDFPNLTPEFIKSLSRDLPVSPVFAIVPKYDDFSQPLCAMYHASAWPEMQVAVRNGERSLQRWLKQCETRVVFVGPDELGIDAVLWDTVFLNINTPEDLEKLAK